MTSSAIRPSARAQARARTSGANNLEKKIMGVPARIMRPCLLLIAIAVALTCFGLVMIYSASSVEAMSEQGDAMIVVTSEETGTISIACKGQLTRNLTDSDLREHLIRYLCGTDNEEKTAVKGIRKLFGGFKK